MNKVILSGRLTRRPEIRCTAQGMTVARYTLAVDRQRRRGEEDGADFINCIAFDKAGEFAEKYLDKGMKIIVSGRIQTGSYTAKDGHKVYTTDIIVDGHEFCERRGETMKAEDPEPTETGTGFMDIPEDPLDDEGLPFE